MNTFFARAYRAVRHPRLVVDALLRRQRLAGAGAIPELQKFWRDQGSEWITAEASDEEVEAFDRLVSEAGKLSISDRRAHIVSTFRISWTESFLNSAEAIDWDMMQEDLPAEALVCFFDGALRSRTGRKTSTA